MLESMPTSFIDAVRHNCNISDAKYAGRYTLCVYLLHMREYYRWEKKYHFNQILKSTEVSEWVSRKEDYWSDIEKEEYMPLPWLNSDIDPFDVAAVNNRLIPMGYCYGAGIGRFGKPIFFVAKLKSVDVGENYKIYSTDEEIVRELVAPPAMTLGDTISIREQSLKRVLWEMVEEWLWKKPQNAMWRTLKCYGSIDEPTKAIESITDIFIESAILHELGERVCVDLLGKEWEEMIFSLVDDISMESAARAVRDNLADCLVLLPALINQNEQAPLHLYFATLTEFRKKLFPTLVDAYKIWSIEGNASELSEIVRGGAEHWYLGAKKMLEEYKANDEKFYFDTIDELSAALTL